MRYWSLRMFLVLWASILGIVQTPPIDAARWRYETLVAATDLVFGFLDPAPTLLTLPAADPSEEAAGEQVSPARRLVFELVRWLQTAPGQLGLPTFTALALVCMVLVVVVGKAIVMLLWASLFVLAFLVRQARRGIVAAYRMGCRVAANVDFRAAARFVAQSLFESFMDSELAVAVGFLRGLWVNRVRAAQWLGRAAEQVGVQDEIAVARPNLDGVQAPPIEQVRVGPAAQQEELVQRDELQEREQDLEDLEVLQGPPPNPLNEELEQPLEVGETAVFVEGLLELDEDDGEVADVDGASTHAGAIEGVANDGNVNSVFPNVDEGVDIRPLLEGIQSFGQPYMELEQEDELEAHLPPMEDVDEEDEVVETAIADDEPQNVGSEEDGVVLQPEAVVPENGIGAELLMGFVAVPDDVTTERVQAAGPVERPLVVPSTSDIFNGGSPAPDTWLRLPSPTTPSSRRSLTAAQRQVIAAAACSPIHALVADRLDKGLHILPRSPELHDHRSSEARNLILGRALAELDGNNVHRRAVSAGPLSTSIPRPIAQPPSLRRPERQRTASAPGVPSGLVRDAGTGSGSGSGAGCVAGGDVRGTRAGDDENAAPELASTGITMPVGNTLFALPTSDSRLSVGDLGSPARDPLPVSDVNADLRIAVRGPTNVNLEAQAVVVDVGSFSAYLDRSGHVLGVLSPRRRVLPRDAEALERGETDGNGRDQEALVVCEQGRDEEGLSGMDEDDEEDELSPMLEQVVDPPVDGAVQQQRLVVTEQEELVGKDAEEVFVLVGEQAGDVDEEQPELQEDANAARLQRLELIHPCYRRQVDVALAPGDLTYVEGLPVFASAPLAHSMARRPLADDERAVDEDDDGDVDACGG
ncbi:hypothetical protein HMN09_00324700 [Mycena chlorophos]|uniref:Uncharacterized protein n=1 Tax=Mycena chlorophos TaxID=658473 RepID=A0A8H6TIG3_MYCCL|nr:hypothetical protein HMN09_00324700 [Mycena chlorophos]